MEVHHTKSEVIRQCFKNKNGSHHTKSEVIRECFKNGSTPH